MEFQDGYDQLVLESIAAQANQEANLLQDLCYYDRVMGYNPSPANKRMAAIALESLHGPAIELGDVRTNNVIVTEGFAGEAWQAVKGMFGAIWKFLMRLIDFVLVMLRGLAQVIEKFINWIFKKDFTGRNKQITDAMVGASDKAPANGANPGMMPLTEEENKMFSAIENFRSRLGLHAEIEAKDITYIVEMGMECVNAQQRCISKQLFAKSMLEYILAKSAEHIHMKDIHKSLSSEETLKSMRSSLDKNIEDLKGGIQAMVDVVGVNGGWKNVTKNTNVTKKDKTTLITATLEEFQGTNNVKIEVGGRTFKDHKGHFGVLGLSVTSNMKVVQPEQKTRELVITGELNSESYRKQAGDFANKNNEFSAKINNNRAEVNKLYDRYKDEVLALKAEFEKTKSEVEKGVKTITSKERTGDLAQLGVTVALYSHLINQFGEVYKTTNNLMTSAYHEEEYISKLVVGCAQTVTRIFNFKPAS